MNKMLLVRNKLLKEMSLRELILWLKKLVNSWDLEHRYMPTGISEIEKEIEKTMKEISERILKMKEEIKKRREKE